MWGRRGAADHSGLGGPRARDDRGASAGSVALLKRGLAAYRDAFDVALKVDGGLDAAYEALLRYLAGQGDLESVQSLVAVAERHLDLDSSPARLYLAELMAESPQYPQEAVAAAYWGAFESALRAGTDISAAYRGWLGYLAHQGDLDGALALVPLARQHPGLDPASTLAGVVHSTRTADRLEDTVAMAERVSPALIAGGWSLAAADVRAEQAQALASLERSEEAIRVCEGAWASGCASVALANRHSLLLERAKRFREAAEICDRGIAIGEKGDQIAKRRARCLAKLS